MLGWVKRRPAIQVVQRASDFRPCKYHTPYPRAELAHHKGRIKQGTRRLTFLYLHPQGSQTCLASRLRGHGDSD